jgi:hypothetical protein
VVEAIGHQQQAPPFTKFQIETQIRVVRRAELEKLGLYFTRPGMRRR